MEERVSIYLGHFPNLDAASYEMNVMLPSPYERTVDLLQFRDHRRVIEPLICASYSRSERNPLTMMKSVGLLGVMNGESRTYTLAWDVVKRCTSWPSLWVEQCPHFPFTHITAELSPDRIGWKYRYFEDSWIGQSKRVLDLNAQVLNDCAEDTCANPFRMYILTPVEERSIIRNDPRIPRYCFDGKDFHEFSGLDIVVPNR